MIMIVLWRQDREFGGKKKIKISLAVHLNRNNAGNSFDIQTRRRHDVPGDETGKCALFRGGYTNILFQWFFLFGFIFILFFLNSILYYTSSFGSYSDFVRISHVERGVRKGATF